MWFRKKVASDYTPLDLYSLQHLKQINRLTSATSDSPLEVVHPIYEGSPYYTYNWDNFIYFLSKAAIDEGKLLTSEPRDKTFSPFKIHFNFDDNEQLEKAWNEILPILLIAGEKIKIYVKILEPVTMTKKLNKNTAAMEAKLKEISATPDQVNWAKKIFAEDRDRRLNSTQMTFYFHYSPHFVIPTPISDKTTFNRLINEIDKTAYIDLIHRIETALALKGITPCATVPQGDEKVGDYTSIRLNSTLDSAQKYIPPDEIAKYKRINPADFEFIKQFIAEYKESPEDFFQKKLALAKSGDPVALNRVGNMYLIGYGVEKNVELAIKSFKRVTENKQPQFESEKMKAYFDLGLIYSQRTPPELDKALENYIAAAELGHVEAALRVSGIFINKAEEIHVHNPQMEITLLKFAENFLRKAVKLDPSEQYQYRLSVFLEENMRQLSEGKEEERKKRQDEATKWLVKAAENGSVKAISKIKFSVANNYNLIAALPDRKCGSLLDADVEFEDSVKRLCLLSAVIAKRGKKEDNEGSKMLSIIAIYRPKIFDEYINNLAEQNQFDKINIILKEKLSAESERVVRDRYRQYNKMLTSKFAEVSTVENVLFKQASMVSIISDYAAHVENKPPEFLTTALEILSSRLTPFNTNLVVKDLLVLIDELKKDYSLRNQEILINNIEKIINPESRSSSSSSPSFFTPGSLPIIQALREAKAELAKNTEVFNFLYSNHSSSKKEGP